MICIFSTLLLSALSPLSTRSTPISLLFLWSPSSVCSFSALSCVFTSVDFLQSLFPLWHLHGLSFLFSISTVYPLSLVSGASPP